MNIINVPPASVSLVASIISPIKSALRTVNNICESAEVMSEAVLEASKLVKDISLLSLEDQRTELMAKRTALRLA